jgi:hypothetical protein
MRQLKIYLFLLIIIVIVTYCGNPKRSVIDSQNFRNSTVDINHQVNRLILPPLEESEVHMTDTVFGSTINIIGRPVHLKERFSPNQVIIKDKYLILNTWSKDSIFMIYELPGFKCISAFGLKYLGPEGFVSPKIVESTEDSVLFYIYENTDDKVYKVTKKHLLPEYYITLPKQKRSLSDKQIAFYDYNSAYYSASTENDRMIYYFNKDSIPQEKLLKVLAIPGKKGSWTTVLGDFGINKYYGRIAYAYKYFKRLKIIDIKTLRERNIIFEARELAKGLDDVATNEPTNITHFWGMSAKENYFWMLYSGRTPIDVQRDNQLKRKYLFVEKYDWNGNPVKRYKLDDWGYFCVDEKNNAIYIASTATINSIVKYNLNDN